MTAEEKMKIVINNYFKSECDVNTSIRDAFEKGFKIGVKKGELSRKCQGQSRGKEQTQYKKWDTSPKVDLPTGEITTCVSVLASALKVEPQTDCDTCRYGQDKRRYAHICNECGVGINNYTPQSERGE